MLFCCYIMTFFHTVNDEFFTKQHCFVYNSSIQYLFQTKSHAIFETYFLPHRILCCRFCSNINHKNATNRTLHWNLDKVNIWGEKKGIDFKIKQGLPLFFTKMKRK